jgi:hypothetical protein
MGSAQQPPQPRQAAAPSQTIAMPSSVELLQAQEPPHVLMTD